ncbi:MAG: helix-turn-helix domain-containing protein, partial [Chitinophagaceae bacterium]
NPRPWKWTDWLHFLPILFYVIDFSVFFLKPASEKIAIYNAIYGNRLFSAFNEGLFTPQWFHIYFRYIFMLAYWIIQFLCLRKAIAARDKSSKDDQPFLFIWLKWLTITQLILIIPPLINLVFRIEKFWIVAQFSGIFVSFVQGYFLLKKPEILYGLEPTFKMEDFQVSNTAMPSENAKNNTPITDQRKLELLKGIIEKMETHFCTNKPYLKQGYGLSDLSIELDCTTHLLSYIINKHYGMNFYSLINHFRIEACKEKLKLREYQQKTLEAIAHESGFQNRGTFIRAFKTYTGNTPSDFIKDLN